MNRTGLFSLALAFLESPFYAESNKTWPFLMDLRGWQQREAHNGI